MAVGDHAVGPGRYELVTKETSKNTANSAFKANGARFVPISAEKVEAPFLVHEARIKGTEDYRSKTNVPQPRQMGFGRCGSRWDPPKAAQSPAPGTYESSPPAKRAAGGMVKSTSEKMPDPPRSMDASDGVIGPGHYYDHSCSLIRKSYNVSMEEAARKAQGKPPRKTTPFRGASLRKPAHASSTI
jgi:hypothetical protein